MRLVELKETFGIYRKLPDCVQKIVFEGLGVEMDEEFKTERVHTGIWH